MTPLDRAVQAIVRVLESEHIDYAIVDGIANAVWGEPRATIDVDVTISVERARLPDTILAIAAPFRVPVSEPVSFVQQTRVLPLDSNEGVRIDVIFALLPFELEAIRRARRVSIAGRTVSIVTPEDLVLMKIVSDRPRDLADAEAIVRRRRDDLDKSYLEPRVRELAAALERDEILERWIRWTAADEKSG
jgi:hypothetical protein